MPIPLEILNLAPIAAYLSANDKKTDNLFNNNSINPSLHKQIYAVYFVLKKIFEKDNNHPSLPSTCNYLWELCGKFGVIAHSISGGGGGGNITPISGVFFPIYITDSNFTSATFYPNTQLIGNNIMVFLNEINRYLIPNTEFTVDSSGLTILLDGFDATANQLHIVIEKVYI